MLKPRNIGILALAIALMAIQTGPAAAQDDPSTGTGSDQYAEAIPTPKGEEETPGERAPNKESSAGLSSSEALSALVTKTSQAPAADRTGEQGNGKAKKRKDKARRGKGARKSTAAPAGAARAGGQLTALVAETDGSLGSLPAMLLILGLGGGAVAVAARRRPS